MVEQLGGGGALGGITDQHLVQEAVEAGRDLWRNKETWTSIHNAQVLDGGAKLQLAQLESSEARRDFLEGAGSLA